jgi:hypothetical protein
VLVDNENLAGAPTPLHVYVDIDELDIANGAKVDLSAWAALELSRLSVTGQSLVSNFPAQAAFSVLELGEGAQLDAPPERIVVMTVDGDLVIPGGASMTMGMDLTVHGDFTIDVGGLLSADGRGYGPGGGGGVPVNNGGGANLGNGGGGRYGRGGFAYGSLTRPVGLVFGFGSGGGNWDGTGGRGGGVVGLRVDGVVRVNGELRADGAPGGATAGAARGAART